MATTNKDRTFVIIFLALAALLTVALLVLGVRGAQAAADLKANDLYPQTYLPQRQGDDITFTYEWENSGDTDATADVTLYVDTGSGYAPKDTDTDLTMNSGESGFGNLTWSASDANGTLNFKVKVDSGNTVTESSEANNEYSYDDYEVEPEEGVSDLWISKVSMEPVDPNIGQTATITFEYGNDGNLTPKGLISVGLFIYPQGEARPDEPASSLPPMVMVKNLENPQWDFDWTPDEGGEFTLELVIDYDDNVSKDSGYTEEDDVNNAVAWDLRVSGEGAKGSDLAFAQVGENLFNSEPATGTIGEHVLFRYTIKNQGANLSDSGWSVALFVKAKNDPWPAQPTNVTYPVNTRIPANGQEPYLGGRPVELGWDIPADAQPGEYDIKVVLDYYENLTKANDKVPENDRSNNEMTWLDVNKDYFSVEQKFPDLKVDSIIPFGQAYEGDQITIQLIIKNFGDIATDNVKVDLWLRPYDTSIQDTLELDGVNIGSVDLDPLFAFYNWNWTPTADGTYQIEVIVDPDNEIEELPAGEKLSDNTKKVDLEVVEKIPDLTVQEVRFTPKQGVGAIVGTPTLITAEILNQGLRNLTTDELDDLQVKFELGTTLVIVDVTENIEAGSTLNVSFNHIFSRENYWTLYITLDPNNRIIEAQEDNNQFTKAIYAKDVIDVWISDLTVSSDPQTNAEMTFAFQAHLDNAPTADERAVDWTVEVFDNVTGETTIFLAGTVNMSLDENLLNITVPWSPTFEGDYRVTVSLIFSADTDENNNQLETFFHVSKYEINLEIAQSGVVVDSLSAGDRSVTIEVRYNGTANSVANVKVWVKVFQTGWQGWDDTNNLVKDLGNGTVDGDITRNDYRTLTYTWANVKKGCYIIVAKVDPDDTIHEINEQDNLFPSKTIAIANGCYVAPSGADDDSDDGPGLGLAGALVAVLAAQLLVARRR